MENYETPHLNLWANINKSQATSKNIKLTSSCLSIPFRSEISVQVEMSFTYFVAFYLQFKV